MFISFGMIMLTVTTIILLNAFRSGIEFYKSPTQLLELKDDTINLRVGGLVMKNSIKSTGVDVLFVITDGTNDVNVKYTGVFPDLDFKHRSIALFNCQFLSIDLGLNKAITKSPKRAPSILFSIKDHGVNLSLKLTEQKSFIKGAPLIAAAN